MVYITPEDYEIAEKNGISAVNLRARINQYYWSKERAITEPIRDKSSRNKKYPDSLFEKAAENGICRQTLYGRIWRGISPEEAVSLPLGSKLKGWSADDST